MHLNNYTTISYSILRYKNDNNNSNNNKCSDEQKHDRNYARCFLILKAWALLEGNRKPFSITSTVRNIHYTPLFF